MIEGIVIMMIIVLSAIDIYKVGIKQFIKNFF